MKILLIEDDTQLCMTIKEQLTKEGYIVDTCNTGYEAFLYAVSADNDYDLAIIDRMLPIIDGLSIIKAMRQKNIQIPVIIITGMSELNDKIEGLDNGADDYLIKPFHIKELSARIRALVRRPPQIKEEDLVTITYASDVTFEILTMDMASLTEISREGTDKESIKKQTSVLIFGSSQDTYHWTADKVMIVRWK